MQAGFRRTVMGAATVAALTVVVTLAQAPPVDVQTLGPQPGQAAIDFSLSDQSGKSWSLASLAGPKGTMLVFSRSAEWCPYCRTQMVEIQRSLADIRAQGFGVAVITYDAVDTLKGFADKYGITYPLLSDQGSRTIDAWGIRNREATGRSAGIPHPGTFMVDPSGVILSRAFEQAYSERRTATTILADLTGTINASSTQVKGAQVSVALSISDTSAAPGHRLTLRATITPKDGHHVYAPGQSGYIPVALTLDPSPDFKSQSVRYPASTRYVFAPLNETVQVYSGPFTLAQDVTLALTPDLRARATKGETVTIRGTIESQACDDKVCYRPESLAVEWTLKLTPIIR